METIIQVEAPAPHDETPEARSVHWVGEASNNEAAKDAAYAAWDQKYGTGKQPVQAITKVIELED